MQENNPPTVKVIDGCEYIQIDRPGVFVHKGNCTNKIHIYAK